MTNPDESSETLVSLPIDGILDLHTFSPREIDDLLGDYIDACVKAAILDLRYNGMKNIKGSGSGGKCTGAAGKCRPHLSSVK